MGANCEWMATLLHAPCKVALVGCGQRKASQWAIHLVIHFMMKEKWPSQKIMRTMGNSEWLGQLVRRLDGKRLEDCRCIWMDSVMTFVSHVNRGEGILFLKNRAHRMPQPHY